MREINNKTTSFATRATVQVFKKLYCFIYQAVHLKLIALLSVFFLLPFVLSSVRIEFCMVRSYSGRFYRHHHSCYTLNWSSFSFLCRPRGGVFFISCLTLRVNLHNVVGSANTEIIEKGSSILRRGCKD